MLTIDEGSELAECIEATVPTWLHKYRYVNHHAVDLLCCSGLVAEVLSFSRGYFGIEPFEADDPVARDVGRWLRERLTNA